MRLIDADALTDRLDALAYDDWNQGTSVSWADAFKVSAEMVRDERAVDAMKIVRCKDCVHWFKGICSAHADNIYMDENDFCSLGERNDATD